MKDIKKIIGLYDFTYSPYALGDLLTFLKKIQCLQHLYNLKYVKLFFFLEPFSPSPKNQCLFINKDNYYTYIKNLVPLTSLVDNVVDVRIFQNKTKLNFYILKGMLSGSKFFPGFFNHLLMKYDYQSHKEIVKLYNMKNFIPKFKVPKQNLNNVSKLINKKKKNVGLNLRQGLIRQLGIMDDRRDANILQWIKFLKMCQINYKDVHFFIFGKLDEINRRLLLLNNITHIKSFGYNLLDEIALSEKLDFFLGSNSGYATYWLFSKKPFFIFNSENVAKDILRNYKKGFIPNKLQNLSFEVEKFHKIKKEFLRLYHHYA